MIRKLLDFYSRHRSFIIWSVGIAVICFILKSSDSSGFVNDYNIVTWDHITIVLIFIGCSVSASKKLFFYENQNEWVDDIQKDIALNTAAIQKLSEQDLSRIENQILQNEQILGILAKKQEVLKRLIYDHLHDCFPIFRCEECNQEFDEITLTNDDGIPMCQSCYSLDINEKNVIRHIQKNANNTVES